jgi:hypothetical protein
VDTLEVRILDGEDIEERMIPPATEFRNGGVERIKPEVEDITWVDGVDLELQGVEGDSAVSIGGSLEAQAKDILDGLMGRFDAEGPEKGLVAPKGLLKTEGRDFQGGGVDLAVVITMDFMMEDGLGLADIRDVIAHAGAVQMIFLKPAIRALDFSFGLGESVDDFDLQSSNVRRPEPRGGKMNRAG